MRLLVCLPHAGAGPALFREWSALLGPDFRIEAPRLPGREDRFLEDPFRSVDEAVSSILPQIAAKAGPASDVTVFGHCFGAILGYELARRWKQVSAMPISRLIVSAAHAPTRSLDFDVEELDDDQLLNEVERMTGHRDPVLRNAEMRDILLPVLRADMAMHGRYQPGHADALDVPIVCVRGRFDHFVTQRDLAAWQTFSHRPIELVEIEGAHMYLVDQPRPLFALLERVGRSDDAGQPRT